MRHSTITSMARGACRQFATLYIQDRFECDAFVLGLIGPAPSFSWIPLISMCASLNGNHSIFRDLATNLCNNTRQGDDMIIGPNRLDFLGATSAEPFIESDCVSSDEAGVILTGLADDAERYIAVFLRKDVSTALYQQFVASKLQQSVPLQYLVKSLSADAAFMRSLHELTAGYDKLRIGVLFADSTGRVLHVNDCAYALLAKTLGHSLVGKSWSNHVLTLIRAYQADQLSALDNASHITTIWRPQFGTDQLLPYYVMNLNNDDAVAHFCIMFSDPSYQLEPMQLLKGLGLTQAESRLASQIIAGKSLKSASIELGLSEESARTYLKRVFSKLGVSRQAELVSAITRLHAPVKS